MSIEVDKKPSRAPENIKVTVTRCNNLKGSKSDAMTSLVRVEFGQTLLGESGKIETTKETKVAEYNFTTSLECSFDEPYSFDSICQKPIIVLIVEVLPKDKKSKEEKSNIIGQCCVDLLPLLKGSKEYTVTLPLTSPVAATNDNLGTELEQPEVEVTVSVAEPLLGSQELVGSNLFTMQVDSAYAVPESWQVGGSSFTYTISLPVPITAQKENTVVIPNGSFRTQLEKEISQKRKWSIGPPASGIELFIQESNVNEGFSEEEHGDLQGPCDANFKQHAMIEKSRVTWNSERRCFLSSEASQSLQEKIAHTRIWPVEIIRHPMPSLAKGKGKQQSNEDEQNITFHGVAFVNMAPLLYPGIKKIQGAYLIKPYIDNEVYEKTKRKGSNFVDDAAQITGGINRILTPSLPSKLPGNKTGPKDSKVKPSLSTLKTEPTSEGEVTDAESQQYTESRTFLILKMELDKPLVPKRPPSSLARKVAEIIPPRPAFCKKSGGAKKAVEDYHTQIVNVANHLLDEFRYLNGDDIENEVLGQSHEDMESRRKAFLYELNTSGKYFAFKEQMKNFKPHTSFEKQKDSALNAVIKIVREKYFHTSSFTDQEELQTFLSDLYAFLIDEMHKGLNKALSIDEEAHVPPSMVDTTTLKHFAEEAEVNQNYELAAKYYQERLARNKNDAENWLDYGTFCLLIGDISKSAECFKETISINQKHFSGLLLNGCVSLMQENYDEAETFFEAATCVDEKSVLAWTVLGIYYDSLQNDIGAERAFLEANRANAATVPRKPTEVSMPVNEVISPEAKEPLNDDLARKGSTNNGEMDIPVQKKSSSIVKIQKSSSTTLAAGMSNNASEISVNDAVDISGNESTNTDSDEKPNEVAPPPVPPPVSIFLQTADFLLNVNALQLAESALAHELLTGGPSAVYHTLLGRLNIQQKNYEEAEENLNQALVLNHQSSNAWSLLGHAKYLTQRLDEARDCYERTLAYVDEPTDIHSVLLRLATIYLKNAEFEKAKEHFLMACKRNPSPVSWLGVGIACYELGSLKEAEDALSEANILNNTDAEVWAYLSLVCLKTGRQLEAEQSYKYAIKLNLQNKSLLNQLHSMQERVGFGNPIAV